MAIEPNDQPGNQLDVAEQTAPPMDGVYNDELSPIGAPPGPYPLCLRGVEFFFALEPNQTYDATAVLQGGNANPDFRLQVFQGDDPVGAGRLFKEAKAGAPASAYKSHTTVADNAYQLGQEVSVKVTVDASGANATITVV
jgi:hypothetical protein